MVWQGERGERGEKLEMRELRSQVRICTIQFVYIYVPRDARDLLSTW